MHLEFLTKAHYDEIAGAKTGHWANAEARWPYHSKAIDFLRSVAPETAESVLEMGTMGASLVKGSRTIDYTENWSRYKFTPTIIHDARVVPWPISDKRYEVFIALRVFQHLVPRQRECFWEAKRIARNVILVVPDSYPDTIHDGLKARGITKEDFLEWNNGVPPTLVHNFENWLGTLYLWTPEAFK